MVTIFKELPQKQFASATIFLDVDGTVLGVGEERVSPEHLNVIASLKEHHTVYLYALGKRQEKRAQAVAAACGVMLVSATNRQALADKIHTLAPSEKPLIIVGDRITSDGRLAALLKSPFVHVQTRVVRKTVSRVIQKGTDALLTPFVTPFIRTPGLISDTEAFSSVAPLVILTREPFSLTRALPLAVRRIKSLGRKTLTDELAHSLKRGLEAINQHVLINPRRSRVNGVVAVLGSERALRIALSDKQRGFVRTILAGPSIVSSPDQANRLIAHPDIDTIVVGAEWVKRWWGSFDQYLENKIQVWTSGVSDEGVKRDPNGICLVYSKNADEKLFHHIMESLWSHKLPITVSHFGEFRSVEYATLLKKTKFVLYLTDTEPSGHVLREAWMADIPTLVLNTGSFSYQGKTYQEENATAPELDESCGMFFSGEADFDLVLTTFLEKYPTFAPRHYALSKFTEKQAAQHFLEIARLSARSRQEEN